MCGIAGVFAYRASPEEAQETERFSLRETMRRRGADGAGIWVADDRRIGLVHRRLAIIDSSNRALQPMATADQRYRITFNGEVYSYRDLRRELVGKGVRFRTDSDIEALLHLYAERGAAMVFALRGMYAFAIWDGVERRPSLARDPSEVKPLYIADDGEHLRSASQVEALTASPKVSRGPDPAGNVGCSLWGAIPEPLTLYAGFARSRLAVT